MSEKTQPSERSVKNVVDMSLFRAKLNQNHPSEPRKVTFKTLRDARKAVCQDVDPVDRLAKALARVQGRANDDEIIRALMSEHQKLCETKDRCRKYRATEGKFKRLFEAWSYFGPVFRKEFLEP